MFQCFKNMTQNSKLTCKWIGPRIYFAHFDNVKEKDSTEREVKKCAPTERVQQER